jgi:hypothetical protein
MTTAVALLTYGNTRFRAVAEPVLLIGVAAALLAAITRYGTRAATGAVTLNPRCARQ